MLTGIELLSIKKGLVFEGFASGAEVGVPVWQAQRAAERGRGRAPRPGIESSMATVEMDDGATRRNVGRVVRLLETALEIVGRCCEEPSAARGAGGGDSVLVGESIHAECGWVSQLQIQVIGGALRRHGQGNRKSVFGFHLECPCFLTVG